MKVLYLLIACLFVGLGCTENVQAQSSGDIQQQINALQQQLDALKRGAGQQAQGVQGGYGAVQQGARGQQQGGTVQLRPIETGRRANLRGQQAAQAAAQAAQGMQGWGAQGGTQGTAYGAQQGAYGVQQGAPVRSANAEQQQLERRLEQLRAEQARRAQGAQGAYGAQQGAPGGTQGAVYGVQQGAYGAQQGSGQGAQSSSGYYTPRQQYDPYVGNTVMPNSRQQRRQAKQNAAAGYNAAGYPTSGYADGYGYNAAGYGAGGYNAGRGAGGYGGGGYGSYDAVAIKTNLASLAVMAPNLGVEFGLGQRLSLDLTMQYNGWGRAPATLSLDPNGSGKLIGSDGTVYKETQTDHLLGKAELRLWLMERMHGQFLGLHALYSKYDVYGMKIPLLFEKDLRYDGTALGFGLSYGYKWEWNNRWGLEASIGLGMVSLDYDKSAWHPSNTQNVEAGRFKKTYFGPTGIGARIYFMLK